jgi:DNA-binding beta-propeller fold protein YncE
MQRIQLIILALTASFLVACSSSTNSSTPASGILGITLDDPATPAKLYIANAANQTIQAVDLSTNAVTTLAGLASNAGSTNATGSSARFYEPFAITKLGGDLYIADTANFTIRKLTTAGVATTLAGTVGTPGSNDATGTSATFNIAKGITGSGNFLYLADTYNHTIRKIDITTGAVTTLAGNAGATGTTDNATGSSARFNYPFSLTTLNGSNIYVSDTLNQTIRVVSAAGAVTTLAGSAGNAGATDASGTSAKFNYPAGIAIDSTGANLYVADSENHVIRKVDIGSGAVTTLAGTAGTAGSTDGIGAAARFNTPIGVAIDNAGNLYVTDQVYTKIRKVTSAGVVTTLGVTF